MAKNESGDIVKEIEVPVIPRRTFFQAIAWMLRGIFLPLFQPKELILTLEQAEHVQSMFLAGSSPEAIGRSVHSLWKRTSWAYLKVFDGVNNRYKFDPADFEMDGLEYLNSAMFSLGALVKKRDGVYYQCDHPMVKRLAEIACQAPIPKRKEG